MSELQLSVKQMEKRRSKELEDAERGKEELRQSMQLELKRCKEHFDQELKGIHHVRSPYRFEAPLTYRLFCFIVQRGVSG